MSSIRPCLRTLTAAAAVVVLAACPAPGGDDPGVRAGAIAEGSPLQAAEGPASRSGDRPCEELADPGWEPAGCLHTELDGSRLVVVPSTAPGSGAIPLWRVGVWAGRPGAWTVIMQAEGHPDTWTGVTARPGEVSGRELVLIGYRFAGTGSMLSYDVLELTGGELTVLTHRPQLANASVVLSDGVLHEFEADYPGAEPACCPPRFAHRTLQLGRDGLEVTDTTYVAPADIPPSLL